jgi:hypothetical protein
MAAVATISNQAMPADIGDLNASPAYGIDAISTSALCAAVSVRGTP